MKKCLLLFLRIYLNGETFQYYCLVRLSRMNRIRNWNKYSFPIRMNLRHKRDSKIILTKREDEMPYKLWILNIVTSLSIKVSNIIQSLKRNDGIRIFSWLLSTPRDSKANDEVKTTPDVRKHSDQRSGCQLQDLFSEKIQNNLERVFSLQEGFVMCKNSLLLWEIRNFRSICCKIHYWFYWIRLYKQ